ncbi:hypothetical protein [Streptomyces sp. FIT100]|uniref:hypothetical protein n=1 Tax=Streptomyces sp. FIT100 TaxID=2837956 RepID=UPI0021C6B54A|nr:hypothetical protein [Streptomyces sp. FIT100]UUN28156.1 hypothetical protein KK483_18505 [Streptomyces sp. FIT100]
MGEFLEAAAAFPTVLFSSALVVTAGFWLTVLLGAAGAETFDADADLDALGMGGVPVSVAGSLLIAFGWSTSLTGSLLLGRAGIAGALHHLLGVLLLLASLLAAWRATRLLVRPLARLFPR